MIHIRTDNSEFNNQRKFACCLGPDLPEGDKWVGEGEIGLHHMVDCPNCKPNAAELGTPFSQLEGRDGGNAEWRRISESWGYP